MRLQRQNGMKEIPWFPKEIGFVLGILLTLSSMGYAQEVVRQGTIQMGGREFLVHLSHLSEGTPKMTVKKVMENGKWRDAKSQDLPPQRMWHHFVLPQGQGYQFEIKGQLEGQIVAQTYRPSTRNTLSWHQYTRGDDGSYRYDPLELKRKKLEVELSDLKGQRFALDAQSKPQEFVVPETHYTTPFARKIGESVRRNLPQAVTADALLREAGFSRSRIATDESQDVAGDPRVYAIQLREDSRAPNLVVMRTQSEIDAIQNQRLNHPDFDRVMGAKNGFMAEGQREFAVNFAEKVAQKVQRGEFASEPGPRGLKELLEENKKMFIELGSQSKIEATDAVFPNVVIIADLSTESGAAMAKQQQALATAPYIAGNTAQKIMERDYSPFKQKLAQTHSRQGSVGFGGIITRLTRESVTDAQNEASEQVDEQFALEMKKATLDQSIAAREALLGFDASLTRELESETQTQHQDRKFSLTVAVSQEERNKLIQMLGPQKEAIRIVTNEGKTHIFQISEERFPLRIALRMLARASREYKKDEMTEQRLAEIQTELGVFDDQWGRPLYVGSAELPFYLRQELHEKVALLSSQKKLNPTSLKKVKDEIVSNWIGKNVLAGKLPTTEQLNKFYEALGAGEEGLQVLGTELATPQGIEKIRKLLAGMGSGLREKLKPHAQAQDTPVPLQHRPSDTTAR